MTSEVRRAGDGGGVAGKDDRRASGRSHRGRIAIYALLLIWTFVALFPLYWTLSTSVKLGRDVTQGHLIPWVDFAPAWKGSAVARAFARHHLRDLERAR